MSSNSYSIVFLDNAINHIFKTVDFIKNNYNNVFFFNHENEFFNFIDSTACDVIFLNLDLLPNDAIIITKEIALRNLIPKPYIILYSNKQDDFAQEFAFNFGADSFINFHTKPTVMLLFLRNLLKRRLNMKSEKEKNLIVDTEKHLIFNKGEALELPRKEFKVFELLYNTPGKFFTKTEIAVLIWLDENVANKRTIDVHIYNIRQVFGKRIIQSQKGKGYRINKNVIG